jgi:ubiquinone/menaquinone biosynthesis C-methylase UbiE
MPADFETYLNQLQLEKLFKQLKAPDPGALAKTMRHFATKEAENRDKIVNDYFGQPAINRMVDTIARALLASPKPPSNVKILDVGAGSGFFTVKVAEEVRAELPESSFYAMDLTPTMLLHLAKKKAKITPFVGIAENIEGSIRQAGKFFKIPREFEAVFSTLMLHHSTRPEKVFESIGKVLKKDGKAIIVDLCRHEFEEFKTEMGDVHLGFKPENIREMAQKHFSTVRIRKIPAVRCESSGRSAEIFFAIMQNPR